MIRKVHINSDGSVTEVQFFNETLIDEDFKIAVPTTKDPTELLKMVHALKSDLQSKDSTTPEMLVALKSIEKQYVKEVQAKNK